MDKLKDLIDREILYRLVAFDGCRPSTAQSLGISVRTLHRTLSRYGLNLPMTNHKPYQLEKRRQIEMIKAKIEQARWCDGVRRDTGSLQATADQAECTELPADSVEVDSAWMARSVDEPPDVRPCDARVQGVLHPCGTIASTDA